DKFNPSDDTQHHTPHSLPTRRSSDLNPPGENRSSGAPLPITSYRVVMPSMTAVAKPTSSRDPFRTCVALGPRLESGGRRAHHRTDRKSTRLNSSHQIISYAVFCLKKK